MSALRHRTGNVSGDTFSPSPSRDGSPQPGEEVKLVPVSKLKNLAMSKRSKRKSGLIFGLGGLAGLIVAILFGYHQEVITFEGLLDVNLESLMDVIPAGMVRDAKDLSVGLYPVRSASR